MQDFPKTKRSNTILVPLLGLGLLLAISGLATAKQTSSTAASERDEAQVVAKGKFEGRSDHVVSGTVTILKAITGFVVRLESDFRLDDAPDPKLGFGKKGYKPDSQFSVLKSKTGQQTYKIPASIDPLRYDELWVWCEEFNVPLGVARLKKVTETKQQ
jgi:hypothetical protein